MNDVRRDKFIMLWSKYFGDAALPIVVFFAKDPVQKSASNVQSGACVIKMLSTVAEGKTLCLSADSHVCRGAMKYLGFANLNDTPDFEYLLSCGIPGRLDGLRYKKSPELARRTQKQSPQFRAPEPYIVFKRWDRMSASDSPEVVVFLSDPDTISGLFNLANFDEAESDAVISPFGSGCSSIVYHPYVELRSPQPRCVLGMFDIYARPHVESDRLSFAVPFPKFERMVENMGESFLVTDSWETLNRRMRSRTRRETNSEEIPSAERR